MMSDLKPCPICGSEAGERKMICGLGPFVFCSDRRCYLGRPSSRINEIAWQSLPRQADLDRLRADYREQADRLSGALAANGRLREELSAANARIADANAESDISDALLADANARIGELELENATQREALWGDHKPANPAPDPALSARYCPKCHTAYLLEKYPDRCWKCGHELKPVFQDDKPATDPHCEGCGDDRCARETASGLWGSLEHRHADGKHWHCYQVPAPEAGETAGGLHTCRTPPEDCPHEKHGDCDGCTARITGKEAGETAGDGLMWMKDAIRSLEDRIADLEDGLEIVDVRTQKDGGS